MRQCAKCGKGSIMVGKRRLLRGHYNPTSKSRKYPNLQFARLPTRPARHASLVEAGGGASGQAKVEGVRKLICVQCMRTMRQKPRK